MKAAAFVRPALRGRALARQRGPLPHPRTAAPAAGGNPGRTRAVLRAAGADRTADIRSDRAALERHRARSRTAARAGPPSHRQRRPRRTEIAPRADGPDLQRPHRTPARRQASASRPRRSGVPKRPRQTTERQQPPQPDPRPRARESRTTSTQPSDSGTESAAPPPRKPKVAVIRSVAATAAPTIRVRHTAHQWSSTWISAGPKASQLQAYFGVSRSLQILPARRAPGSYRRPMTHRVIAKKR
jgi:hypothetical protein